ncbi:hypothetical protein WK03_15100 [Burkholderia cepacia]|uniref:hypothetical protein n=1 Tax=Burkholderia cepacia TaxID=292 RepID=UPI0007595EFA|nr:hypothetical protein [Burkholderia cepacia]KVQ46104.1 hypothetical protein WK03_15100 [Burkholderia cepacia]
MKTSLEDNEFKQAFLEGNLAIDCLEITLTQNGVDNPKHYNLVGSLFVNPENGVEARLVWERDADHPYDQFASFNAMQQIQSGDIFPEDHYFSLRAVDTAGRGWTHPAVFLKRVELEQAEILTISCDFIRVELDTPDKRTLAHFVFHEELGIRMNSVHSSTEPLRNGKRQTTRSTAAKGVVDGFEIDYYPVIADKVGTAHELSAVAKPETSPPSHFDGRLLEAIQFSVAKMAWPIMREVIQGGKQTITLSKSRPFNNGHVQAAVPDYAYADFYRLIERYYKYACSVAQGDEAPPLSKKIGGLFTLKGVWLDTIALLLGVSVESLLNEPVYKKLGVPDDEGRGKIQELIDHVTEAPFDPGLKVRAANIMGGMKSSSASDRLHVLAKAGVIDEEDIKAWKSIRHAAAHGGLEVDQSKLQSLLERVNRLVAMTYKLAFFRIGYQGLYTDYATRGWPAAHFDAVVCNERLDKLGERTQSPDQAIER